MGGGAGYLSHGLRVSLPPAPLEVGDCQLPSSPGFFVPPAARGWPLTGAAPRLLLVTGTMSPTTARGRRVAFTCISPFLLGRQGGFSEAQGPQPSVRVYNSLRLS